MTKKQQSTVSLYKMHRARVLDRWAKVSGADRSELEIPKDMLEILCIEEELTRQDMKRWILRECDIADYKYWMPHLIISGNVVRVYYTWVKKGTPPEYTIVLVVGGGLAQIHKWNDGKLIESVDAKTGEKTGVGPTAAESLQIANYMSNFAKKEGAMTVNGSEVKKIAKIE